MAVHHYIRKRRSSSIGKNPLPCDDVVKDAKEAKPARERRKSIDLGIKDVLSHVAQAVASPHLPKGLWRLSNSAAAEDSANTGATMLKQEGGGRMRSRRGSVDKGGPIQVKMVDAVPQVRQIKVADG